MAAWQMVEMTLFVIFRELVRPGQMEGARPLSAAFHTTPSFRGRLDMTNAAAKETMPENRSKEWDALYKKALKRARRRNSLAHSIVAFEPFSTPPRDKFYLRPNVLDAKRTPFSPADLDEKEIIQKKELLEISHSFETLHQNLIEFSIKLVTPKEP